MISTKTLRTLAAATLLSLVACSPSSKNEEQYWTNHNAAVTEYGGRWPGFAPALSAQQAKAKPVWDEAVKLGDEKAKAEKMKEANGILGKLVGKLEEVKLKSKGIEDGIRKLAELKLTKDKDGDRKSAMEAASKLLAEVEGAMAAAKPASEEEAIKVADEQISKLISGSGSLERATASLKPKDQPAAAKKKK